MSSRGASDEVIPVVERGVRVAVGAQLALEVETAPLEVEPGAARRAAARAATRAARTPRTL